MAAILIAGVAVVDFVFLLDEMPTRAEKHRAKDAAIVGGGCGANAAVAVARLGGTARLAARLGDDPVGAMIVADLEAEGVDCTLARRFPGGRSSFSSVFIDAAGERQIVNFRDPNLSFDAGWLQDAMPGDFDAALADTRWPQGAAALLAAARARSRPGVLDAEPPIAEAAEALQLASHVAFSAQGLREFTGIDGLEKALQDAVRQTKAWLCVTDGPRGVIYLDENAPCRVPAFETEVLDTLGAGDIWHGAFTLALGEGRGEIDAIRFANAAAAIKCTRFGGRAGTPNRQEVEQFMGQRA
ncbi:MAG: PfkB family carbohydrate kinase [Rhizobiaceae bacterium]